MRRFPLHLLALASNVALPVLAPSQRAGAQASLTGGSFARIPSLKQLGHLVALPGSSVPQTTALKPGAALASSKVLNIGVSLRVRDEAALQQFLSALYDP